jgi:hypothetical protein
MKILSLISTLILSITIGNTGFSAVQCNGPQVTNCHNSLSSTGSPLFQVRDFREVMPGILYRGGAAVNGKHTELNATQREALCEGGIGISYYLYSTGFTGVHTNCSNGKQMEYKYKDYASAPATINQRIYKSIHDGAPPVFVHCWYGIHATGFIAATALIQFCGFTHSQAVEYWKIGVAKKVQYPKVIKQIKSFKVDPGLLLTPAEKDRVCPNNPFK